jgi:hypothetical protein
VKTRLTAAPEDYWISANGYSAADQLLINFQQTTIAASVLLASCVIVVVVILIMTSTTGTQFYKGHYKARHSSHSPSHSQLICVCARPCDRRRTPAGISGSAGSSCGASSRWLSG